MWGNSSEIANRPFDDATHPQFLRAGAQFDISLGRSLSSLHAVNQFRAGGVGCDLPSAVARVIWVEQRDGIKGICKGWLGELH